MQKKLTVTMDEKVYEGLYTVIGRRHISRFIEDLVRPHVLYQDLEAAYEQMAQDEERESEAFTTATASSVRSALSRSPREETDRFVAIMSLQATTPAHSAAGSRTAPGPCRPPGPRRPQAPLPRRSAPPSRA